MVQGIGLGSFGVTALVIFNPLALGSGWHLHPRHRRPRYLIICSYWVCGYPCWPRCCSLHHVALLVIDYTSAVLPSSPFITLGSFAFIVDCYQQYPHSKLERQWRLGCWGWGLAHRGLSPCRGTRAVVLVPFRLCEVHLSSPSC
jgi:hypothetical protein